MCHIHFSPPLGHKLIISLRCCILTSLEGDCQIETKSSPQRWLAPPAILSDNSLVSALGRAYCSRGLLHAMPLAEFRQCAYIVTILG